MNTDQLDFLNNSWGCGFCPIDPTKEDAVKPARGLGASLFLPPEMPPQMLSHVRNLAETVA